MLFNRISGINIVGDPFFHRSWNDVFAAAAPHEIVKRVEAGLMLTPPSPAPPTTSITIVHRVIAQVLATVVNERRS
ncbi:hypothetical protein C5C35_14445 [Rathayibacter sp. AY1F8]|nr:hypothetical protein [Rathayibacter sp. AY1F8]PPH14628.1 hypothetical protein C5C35_14445 [Rathayibacter sp. AY1F8]